MAKLEIPSGYVIILEQDDHETGIQNAEFHEENIHGRNIVYSIFTTVLQSMDCLNRNNRIYKGKLLIEALNASHINEMIHNGRWFGEMSHPFTKDVQRIMTPVEELASHKILEWWTDKNLIKGKIMTLDNNGNGTILTRHIMQNCVPAFSLRALASINKKNNIFYVDSSIHVVTYDEVTFPSHKEAYAIPSETKIITKDIVRNKELVIESGLINLDLHDINTFISESSENVKVACESFNISPNEISVLNNGMISISEGQRSNKYVIPLEKNLRREYMNYMSSLLK